MKAAPIAFLLVASMVLAGCAGDSGAKASPSSAITTAPTATANDEFGSITGLVVDDEQQPIVGATVGLLKQDVETKADASGRFTFNELVPGKYDLVAAQLGYEQATRRVEVVAGQVVEASLVLTALIVTDEPTFFSSPKTTLIQFGNAYSQFVTQQTNVSALHTATCEVCEYPVHYPPKPTAVMAEAHWACGQCNAAVNNEVWYKVLSTWTKGDLLDGNVIINDYLSNRERYVYNAEDAKTVRTNKVPVIMAQFGADLEGISVQHKFETIHSFAYNIDEWPENFTALPPQ